MAKRLIFAQIAVGSGIFYVISLHISQPSCFMKRILPLFFLLLLLVTGCRKKVETPTEAEAAAPDSTLPTPSHAAAPDTTIYGVATDDFGMSTFAYTFTPTTLS